jgi:hypothetical protein
LGAGLDECNSLRVVEDVKRLADEWACPVAPIELEVAEVDPLVLDVAAG